MRAADAGRVSKSLYLPDGLSPFGSFQRMQKRPRNNGVSLGWSERISLWFGWLKQRTAGLEYLVGALEDTLGTAVRNLFLP